MIQRRWPLLLLLGFLPLAQALEVKVELQGLDGPQEENVRLFLSIEGERKRPELTPSRVRYLHQRAPEEIREALQPLGYFQAEVTPELVEDGDRFLARYQVAPGAQVRLERVDFQVMGPGKDDPLFAKGLPLKVGDVLLQAPYEAAKQSLLARALEKGYLDAQYREHRVVVDLDDYQASIHLHLDTGPRYRVGAIRFHQDEDVLNPGFLGRYPTFREGDLLNQDDLLNLQSRLSDSEYFAQVEVRPRRDQAEGDRIPVDINLTPAKANRYRAGLGYATDSGPRLSLDWERRRIGRDGHRGLAELSLAPALSFIKWDYIIPLEKPWQDLLSFTAGAQMYDTDTRKGNSLTLGASQVRGLDDDWRRTLGLEYVYEDFEVTDDPGTQGGYLMPSVSWSHLRTDGSSFVRRGHRLNYQLVGAFEPLLSESSFVQFHAKAKSIFSFHEDWRVLTNVQVGATQADTLDDVPVSKRFFAGGDNSIRGYDLDQLGPEDEDGDVIGGRYLLTGSLELERRLVGKWSAALFYDLGNAFDPDYENRLAQGAGIGVRWQSPVGPVRLDLASALSEDGYPWRVHLVIGPDL